MGSGGASYPGRSVRLQPESNPLHLPRPVGRANLLSSKITSGRFDLPNGKFQALIGLASRPRLLITI